MAKRKKVQGGFTMKEYMQQHGIPGNPHSPIVNKLMREHFARVGLHKTRKGNRWVWVPAEQLPVVVTAESISARLQELSHENRS